MLRLLPKTTFNTDTLYKPSFSSSIGLKIHLSLTFKHESLENINASCDCFSESNLIAINMCQAANHFSNKVKLTFFMFCGRRCTLSGELESFTVQHQSSMLMGKISSASEGFKSQGQKLALQPSRVIFPTAYIKEFLLLLQPFHATFPSAQGLPSSLVLLFSPSKNLFFKYIS